MHSNLRTVCCAHCGEPVAPQEGVPQHVEGRPRFVHAGCQRDSAKHNDRVVCEDDLDFTFAGCIYYTD